MQQNAIVAGASLRTGSAQDSQHFPDPPANFKRLSSEGRGREEKGRKETREAERDGKGRRLTLMHSWNMATDGLGRPCLLLNFWWDSQIAE